MRRSFAFLLMLMCLFTLTARSDISGGWRSDGSTVSLCPDGQPLQPVIPGPRGIWTGFPENDRSDVMTLCVGKERFILQYTVFDGDVPVLNYGGYWFEGTYWLEGTWSSTENGLTLTSKQGDVFTLTQDPVTGFLVTESGCPLCHYD